MMYWTDWGRKPRIESAWMDGQHREVLVNEEDLGWPTGLAVDYVNGNRIYWCDSKENIIESMKPDGTDRKIIISGGQGTAGIQDSNVAFYSDHYDSDYRLIIICIKFCVFSVQILDIHTIWMFLRDMFTGRQKTKVKCGRQTSLGKEIKSKS